MEGELWEHFAPRGTTRVLSRGRDARRGPLICYIHIPRARRVEAHSPLPHRLAPALASARPARGHGRGAARVGPWRRRRPSPSTSAAHGTDAEQRGRDAAAGALRARAAARACGGRCAAGAQAERRRHGRPACRFSLPLEVRRPCSSFAARFSPVASPWGRCWELQSASLGAPGGARPRRRSPSGRAREGRRFASVRAEAGRRSEGGDWERYARGGAMSAARSCGGR